MPNMCGICLVGLYSEMICNCALVHSNTGNLIVAGICYDNLKSTPVGGR